MEATIKTKYNIGDELYVWHYISHDNMKPCDWHSGYEKLKVEYIKVTFCPDGEQVISYFFEGLSSYEGENWFIESNPYPELECIFETEEKAKAFQEEYNKKYKTN